VQGLEIRQFDKMAGPDHAFTLHKNGIELPDSFYTVASNFHPKLPPKKQ